jgi:hypothetical protein
MKTLVVLLSKTFFPQHPKAGQPTNFADKIQYTILGKGQREICGECREKGYDFDCKTCTGASEGTPKNHTCRRNYEYWKAKIDKLKAAGGVLSVREWIGKPYKQPGQNVIIDIPAEDAGVQKLTLWQYDEKIMFATVDEKEIPLKAIANNDGLSVEDFIAWFAPVFEKEKTDILDFAIIHFTKFRY